MHVHHHRYSRLAVLAAIALALLLHPLATVGAADPADLPPPPQVAGVAVPMGQVEQAIDSLDGLAASILERSGIPGLAVAVVHGGRTVFAKGYGVRTAGEAAAVNADTVFLIASVSKSVGATVVARQVGAGIIAWDTPVVAHLPWFALADDWVSRTVTIGDLYAHRSGLPSHAGDDLEDLGYDRRQVLERLRLLPLHPFRSHSDYTNFGLTAAAEAVAEAAGSDWASLSEDALYAPLGMASTSSRHADFLSRDNRAAGHVPGDSGFEARYQRQPDAQSPAGGVSSSVRDMARWMTLVLQDGRHQGQDLIPPAALLPAISAQIVSYPSYAPDARPGFYGFGFGVSVQPSGRISIGHSGAFAMGWGSSYTLLPSLDLGIVVLTNAVPIGVAEALAMEFADLAQYGAISRDWLATYGALISPMLRPEGALAGAPRPVAPAPAAALSSYVGRYGNAYFGAAEIVRDPDGLVLQIGPAGMRFPLSHWNGDRFTFTPVGENAPAGSISLVSFERSGSDAAGAVTIEFFDTNGLGTFRR